MKFRQIEDLLSLKRHKFNISRTALSLGRAQSSLSRSLMLFEERMRQPLFFRRGRRVIGLTPFGESLIPDLEKIEMLYKNLIAHSNIGRQSDQGEITIATTHTQARYFIPEVVLSMRRHFPSIGISLQQGNPEQLISMLRNHEADFAVCTEAIESATDLIYEVCYTWRHVVVVPKDHVLSARNRIRLEELASYPLVTYVFGFTGRRHFQNNLEKRGLQPKMVLSAMDTDVIKHYVRLGVGVGVIADICYELERDQDLRMIELSEGEERFETKIAWLKEKYLTKAMRHTLRAVLKEGLNVGSAPPPRPSRSN